MSLDLLRLLFVLLFVNANVLMIAILIRLDASHMRAKALSRLTNGNLNHRQFEPLTDLNH